MKRLSPLFVALLLASTPVSAATFRTGDTVAVPTPVVGDLYAAGSAVSIQGNDNGDVFIMGGKVDLQNRVEGSASIAGGNVAVTSTIGKSLRVAGGDVVIRGTIEGDLLVMGGNVTVGTDAVIMGDAYVNGGTVLARGTFGKSLTVNGGNVSLEGIFHGGVSARGQHIVVAGPVEGDVTLTAESIELEPNANFKGNVQYWSRGQVDFSGALSEGANATFHPELMRAESVRHGGFAEASLGALTLFALLSALLILLVLLLSTKTFFIDAAKDVKRRPIADFFLGLGFFVLTPFVILFLFATIIGIPLALAALAGYVVVLVFAYPVSAMILAHLAARKNEKKWSKSVYLSVSLGIFLLLKIVSFVPVIGWACSGVVVLACIGALLRTKIAKWKKIR